MTHYKVVINWTGTGSSLEHLFQLYQVLLMGCLKQEQNTHILSCTTENRNASKAETKRPNLILSLRDSNTT